MTIENRELYFELKELYPEFFGDLYSPVVLARACGKSLLRTVMIMSKEYTRWFVEQLNTSERNMTREEYELGLKTIEKIIIGIF
jgi:hypothetical protein